MLSAEDYEADLAERYGWINRALPADALGDFVRSLAHRIARFPAAGRAVVKERVNAIALAPVRSSVAHPTCSARECVVPRAERQISAALEHGLQTRDGEMALARVLGDLTAR